MADENKHTPDEKLAIEILAFLGNRREMTPVKLKALTFALTTAIYEAAGGDDHDPGVLYQILGKNFSQIGTWIEGWRVQAAERLSDPKGRA